MAFIVEAMVLLLFLVAALAVFVQMFAYGLTSSRESEDLTNAVAAATQTAEHFAANPASVEEVSQYGDLAVVCEVTPERHDNGTLFRAQITVYHNQAEAETALAERRAAEAEAEASFTGKQAAPERETPETAIYSMATSKYEIEVI